MPTSTPRGILEVMFDKAAREYLASLPLEHFMEGTDQATQRKITVACMDLVNARCPDVQTFNELAILYRRRRETKIRKVVPDNMVVRWHEPIQATGSYNLPLQPVGPLCVMEYVSKSSERKDYEANMQKYERDLKVPYYLLFYPEIQEMTLYRHNGRKYLTVNPNAAGRYPIPELDMEVGLLDGWVRYWHRGQLLPLPAELQHDLDETRKQLLASQRQATENARRAEEEARRADEATRSLGAEREARAASERALAELRSQLEQLRPSKKNHS